MYVDISQIKRRILLSVILILCLGFIFPVHCSETCQSIRVTSSGILRYSAIGMNVLYESNLWHPDLWTLLSKAKVRIIRFWDDWLPPSYDRWKSLADEAHAHGVKVMFVITGDGRPEADNLTLLKARIDGFEIEKLQNNLGVWGYDICNEPSDQQIDSLIPQQAALYVKEKDPTHLTTIGLRAPYQGLPEDWQTGISKVADYIDVVQVHTYRIADFIEGKNLTKIFGDFFDDIVIPASDGKPVILGECGCWTETGVDFKVTATFSEDDQVRYFSEVYNACKARNIVMFPWKLVDNVAEDDEIKCHYGWYRKEIVDGMNIAKKVVNYFSS